MILLPQVIYYLGGPGWPLFLLWSCPCTSLCGSSHTEEESGPSPGVRIHTGQLKGKKGQVWQVWVWPLESWHVCRLFWSHNTAGLMEERSILEPSISTGQGPTSEGRRPSQVLPSPEEVPRLVMNSKYLMFVMQQWVTHAMSSCIMDLEPCSAGPINGRGGE